MLEICKNYDSRPYLNFLQSQGKTNKHKGPEAPENERINEEKEEIFMDTVRGGLKKTVLYQIWLERIFQGGFVRNRPWMGSKTEHTE